MKRIMAMRGRAFIMALGFLVSAAEMSSAQNGEGSGYYKVKPMFLPAPSEKGTWNVKNFGPVGIGIDLAGPNMTMVIQNVEQNSPAANTGKLKKGQIIESINGKVMKDRDPREILGDLITEAEAGDGMIRLRVKDVGEVAVQIPVMGAYSPTWPLNCQKSDKIVRNLADLLANQEKPRWGSVLFLLSTGEEKDLAVVRKWMATLETVGDYPWHKGYMGPGLCEYYLRTGDQRVLPVIKKMTEELKVLEYNGGWSGRGGASFAYGGGGQMHAAGVHCLTFLLLSRYCGVDVDEGMLQRSLRLFYRYAGHENVPYGDHLPEGGFRDNGKTAGLAMAMEAAVRLAPDGENSNYAKARDLSAMKSFYSTSWFHSAHTGGGIGEIWHHAAMGLLHDKLPNQYRSFMDTRRWVMELSRRWDGSIGIAGVSDRYDESASEAEMSWGTYFALTYTAPRKKLQIFGAPRTEWCKSYSLPERPWGTVADDAFLSSTPISGPGGITMGDLLKENVQQDSSAALIDRIGSADAGEDVLRKYLAHPDFGIRALAMNAVVSQQRTDLVLAQLRSDDPRSRYNGILAITGMFKGKALPNEQLTPEMFDVIGKIVENRDESWWVLQGAVNALGRAEPKVIAQHRDRLLELLKNDDWWIQVATLNTLANIADQKELAAVILPPMIKTFASLKAERALYMAKDSMKRVVAGAGPEAKELVSQCLRDALTAMPFELKFPGGYIVNGGGQILKSRVGDLLKILPGGNDFVNRLPSVTTAYAKSGDPADLYRYSGTFTPNKAMVGNWGYAINRRPKTEAELPAAAEQFAREIEAYTKAKRKIEWKDWLVLSDGGKVNSKKFPGHIWSGDMMIDLEAGVARKMEIRKFGGKDFLIIESSGFGNDDAATRWDQLYTIYMRVE